MVNKMTNEIETIEAQDEVQFYGDKELRWYQVACGNHAISDIEKGLKRILIVLPTGTGKTLTVVNLLCDPRLASVLGVNNRKLRVLYVAHLGRLLTQAERTFADENNIELILQSMMSPIPEQVMEAGFDIVVMDEAHHEAATSMQYQLDRIADKPFIGLTATPDRADGMVIKFQSIINPLSREQAVSEGYLAETYLHTFVDGSERSKSEVVKDILNGYADKMEGTLIFVRTKKEVTEITRFLKERNYKAVALLNQSNDELNELLDQFSNKEIQFLVSCKKISEGIDVKNCSDVVIGQTVGSYPLLNQIIGRAARPDCDCRIWEIVNPLAYRNLDTTVVTGIPKEHKLVYVANNEWVEEVFNYSAHTL